MKKIVSAGDRVYLKYFDLSYFHDRAREADATFIPFKSFDEVLFKAEIADADALVVIDRPIRAEHIAAMDRCRIIQALEVGYDFIDVAAATAKGIFVSNVPAYCPDEVATHTIALVLALARKIKDLMVETGKGGWDYKAGAPMHHIAGGTLGIVGLGRIGRRVVPKAEGLGFRVIAYDPYLPDDIFDFVGAERVRELDDLLSRADYVTLHIPLTNETHQMIGARELALMKTEAFLVNTCRGMVIGEKALGDALDRGTIAGAGLDVLQREPPEEDRPILSHPRAIVTPHAAWYSEESLQRVKDQGLDEVVRVLSGLRPWNAVNPEVLTRR